MDVIIQSTLKTLNKTKVLLDNLSNDQLCDATVSPYYSSIGSHLRHILDFYNCILIDTNSDTVDLTARTRDKAVESDCGRAENYLNLVIDKLNTAVLKTDKKVTVIDDLGMGKIEIPYTYGALLAQANSHTIHHYAIINYIFDRLGIVLSDTQFGYNPTTPKKQEALVK